jgi:hypothetical protein
MFLSLSQTRSDNLFRSSVLSCNVNQSIKYLFPPLSFAREPPTTEIQGKEGNHDLIHPINLQTIITKNKQKKKKERRKDRIPTLV